MDFFTKMSVVPPWLWLAFVLGIVVLLIVDLSLFKLFERKGKNRRWSLIESAMWIGVALSFNAWFWMVYGADLGVEFLTAYVVEKSLSVDNLFVILLIFQSLKIPDQYQHRVLFYGILGAIVFRAIFIVLGAQLLHEFHWIIYIFGVILILTAIKFLRDTEESVDPQASRVIRVLGKLMPIADRLDGEKFFIRQNGVSMASPLLVALVMIEATDIVFAVDSIPAVFAVTRDGFVAFASNILAVLGLRALYFVLADLVGQLRYLKPGLAVILGWVGVKMLIIDIVKIPSWVSLLVIFGVLTTAALSSWYVVRMEKRSRLSEGQGNAASE